MDARVFKYPIYSQAFLERATHALQAFDEYDRPSDLYCAALELRYGIEARLFEYIEASLGALRQEPRQIKAYSATKLLAIFTGIEERAEHAITLRISSDASGECHVLHYTPVTRNLASIHGKLGGLLHYTFFANNPAWFVKERAAKTSDMTLLNARDIVNEGIVELRVATSGALLSPPHFMKLVEVVNNEPDASRADGAV